MAELDQERVRSRAYSIWEREGRPWGRDDEFWYRAENELNRDQDLDGIGDPLTEPRRRQPGGFATGGEHGVS